MFRNPPKVIGHISALKKGPFVGQEYIMSKVDDEIKLFNRLCPHRFYPIGEIGDNEIKCKLHGFSFNSDGSPQNNPYKLNCQSSNIGKSGIVFKNFIEPNHKWVDDVANETNLEYSHSYTGESEGSWLWQMEIQTDLFHIKPNGIHPWLETQIDINDIIMENGNGWIYQQHKTGWWVFIFPYIFLEWSDGCLAINSTFPKNKNAEWGYDWLTQFYFDSKTTISKRKQFDRIEEVFREDIKATEKQKVPFVPYKECIHELEKQSVIFGEWVEKNRIMK